MACRHRSRLMLWIRQLEKHVRSHRCTDFVSLSTCCNLMCNLGGKRNLGCLTWTSSLGTRQLWRKRTSSTACWTRCLASRWRSNVCFLVLASGHHLGFFLASSDLGLLFDKDFFVFKIVFVVTVQKMLQSFQSTKVINQSAPVCIVVNETREITFLFTNNAFVTSACKCVCSIESASTVSSMDDVKPHARSWNLSSSSSFSESENQSIPSNILAVVFCSIH